MLYYLLKQSLRMEISSTGKRLLKDHKLNLEAQKDTFDRGTKPVFLASRAVTALPVHPQIYARYKDTSNGLF